MTGSRFHRPSATLAQLLTRRRRFLRALPALLLVLVVAAGPLAQMAMKPVAAAFPGDNGKIAFASSRTTGAGEDNPEGDAEIFAMNPDGRAIEQLTVNDGNDYDPAFNHHGSKIVFTSQRDNQNEDIYVMDAAPESATNQPVRLTNNATSDFGPNWSPDGSKVAFTSNRDGNNNIYVMNALDGSVPKRLTKKRLPMRFPPGRQTARR